MSTTNKESVIERELTDRVRAAGGLCEKVRVIGKRGFFDRIVVLNGHIVFVECKRQRGGWITPHQTWYRKLFEAQGAACCVVRNSGDISELLKMCGAAHGDAAPARFPPSSTEGTPTT